MAQRKLPEVGGNTRFGRNVNTMENVWVFNGNGAACPSAVFGTREKAEHWINANGVQGMLTKYPIDISVYDFAILHGWFTPQHVDQRSSEFIQRFTSASQEHYHYDNDRPETCSENTK